MNDLIDKADFAALIESNPLPCMLLSPDLKIVTVSDTYAKATKIIRDEVKGRYVFDVFPDNPEDKLANGVGVLHTSLKRVLTLKKYDVMAVQKYDIPLRAGGFEEKYWSCTNTPVMNRNKDVLFIIHRAEDVTESVALRNERLSDEKNIEKLSPKEKNEADRVRQAQRMEAMGQLAGGVAHDFNNILNIIMLTCEEVLSDSALTQKSKMNVGQILKNSESAAALTRQLLAFSRRQILQPTTVNLNSIVAEMDQLYRRLLPETIRMELTLADDLGATLIDRGQVEQILMNLVVNARDAMPHGGDISIETANVYLDKSLANGQIKVDVGHYAMIAVRDTGMGMDPETQARIFEPFFTTKGVGKGTGLGLSTVYGIVSQNRGTIWIYSEPGRGTVFKIYLPLVGTVADIETAKEAPAVAAPSTDATILVVEDQCQLRELVCSDLKRRGFKVLEAENGLKALTLLDGLKDKVDLIITDVIMPEMGGPQLAEKLTKTRPDTKILFLSGYTDDMLENFGTLGQQAQFLEKPFRREVLVNKINQILSS